ncbi:DUF410-domain-containing protein [Hesseltinella vesiculosa]|uniref:DUF410-domain-containing protein n=1 Tax=Hesseltinella vesiculosa TaxID=101127 RepID=A0A1X2GX95_9FUNG|nr:DUF410-domain-containing protein [Hesseltinella vesiculosa]
MYRTVARRYNKQQQYKKTIHLLNDGATSFMKHGQSSSGSDLANYMLDTYKLADLPVDETSLNRVVDLLDLYPSSEPGRKQFISKAFSWTQKNGKYPEGDPELHDFVGTLLYQEKKFALAEEHLVVGTDHSAKVLAQVANDWAENEGHGQAKSIYITRVVLQYLAMKSIRHATIALTEFLASTDIEKKQSHDFKFTPAGETIKVTSYSDSWLNFVQLLLLTVQRDGANLFNELKSTYSSLYKQQKGFEDLMDDIGATFFNVAKPRKQGNIMQDLMNSLFAAPAPGNDNRSLPSAAPSLGLD